MGMESCLFFVWPLSSGQTNHCPSNPYSYPCHQGTQGNPARQVRLVSRCSKDGPAWIQEMEVAKATHDTRQEDPIPNKMLANSSRPLLHEERPAIFVAPGVQNNESLSIPTAAGWPHARPPSGQRSPLQCDTQIRCHYTSRGCSLHQALPLTPC